MEHVHSIGKHLFLDAVQLLSGHDGLQPAAQSVGQRAAFGQEFLAYLGHGSFLDFAIYEYVVHFFFLSMS